MAQLFISVIVCAFNPRKDYFSRVLEGLRLQSMPFTEWELIIIDNNSSTPLNDTFDTGWHPNSKVIVESNPGLAHARKRGFEESKGKLIVCVDDDVILQSDYLETSFSIYNSYPFLGVFGCQIRPEFEKPPTLKMEYYGNAERIVEKDIWSNDISEYKSTPFGAGMCIRSEVAKRYLDILAAEPNRLELGRKGSMLLSCEDIDIVFAACEFGYGKGMFKSLLLTHFVPEKKMTVDYLIRNSYWNSYSYTLQNYNLFGIKGGPARSNISKIAWFLRLLKINSFERKTELSKRRGERDALKFINSESR